MQYNFNVVYGEFVTFNIKQQQEILKKKENFSTCNEK